MRSPVKKGVVVMLDLKVSKLLNEQINKEINTAYLYLDFSVFYENQGLDGFANW